MTAEGDAWLREMWSYCRELPRAEREEKRIADAVEQAFLRSQPVDNDAESVDREAS